MPTDSLSHHWCFIKLLLVSQRIFWCSFLELHEVCDFLRILLRARLTDSDSHSLQISKLKQQLQLQRSKAAVSGGPDGGRQRDQSQESCSLGATQVTRHQTNGLNVRLCVMFCSWCDKRNRLQHGLQLSAYPPLISLIRHCWSCSTLTEI